MNWLRRFIVGVFALAITLAVIGGTPVLLLRVAGNPLPKHMPTIDEIIAALSTPDNGNLFLRALTVIGWFAWATFTISVLIEIPAAMRGRRARRILGMRLQQKVAAALVGSVIAVFAGASVAHAMVAAPVPAAVAPAVVKPAGLSPVGGNPVGAKPMAGNTVVVQPAAVNPAAALPKVVVKQKQMVYVVVKGDYLGRIAERFTGKFDNYHDLTALNSRLIRNPHHIEPGWRIVLPADAVDRGIMSHATGKVLDASVPVVTPPPQPPPPPSLPPSPSVKPSPTVAPAVNIPPTKAPALAQPPTTNASESEKDGLHAPLAAGAAIAAASVLSAHVIVRRRQVRRRRQSRTRRRPPAQLFLPAGDTEAGQSAARHRAADRLDASLRRLSVGLRGRAAPEMPDIAAAWQNGGDLSIILTSPCPDPPAPYEERWANTWSLPASVRLPETSWAPSPLPALLTFATWPQGGELLVDGERTGLLTLTGDPGGCEDLLRSLAAEAATAAWADGAAVQVAGMHPSDMQALARLNPGRVRTNGSIPDALSRLSKRAAANAAILRESQIPDIMLARINNVSEASWLTHVLFVADPWGEHTEQLKALDAQLAGLRRVGVAVIATHPVATRWSATVSPDSSLHMAWLAVAGARARQLTTGQLFDLAAPAAGEPT
jgi:LysM domain